MSLTVAQGWQFPTKKLFRGRRNRLNNWFVRTKFRLFRGTENSCNSVTNHSAQEKNARNSVPWNKNRSKLSEYRSEPFRRRENNSDCSVKQKQKQALGILFRTILRKRKQLGIPFRGTEKEIDSWNSVLKLSRMKKLRLLDRIFCKTNFFHAISFRSEPRN